MTNIKYIQTVKKYKEIVGQDFEDLKQYCQDNYEQNYNTMMFQKEIIHVSDDECISSDDEDECNKKNLLQTTKNERKKKQKFLKHIEQTVHESINYDKTYLKLYHCIGILQAAGFKTIDNKSKIKPDFKAMAEYINENEHDIRILFDCKKIEFDVDKIKE
jgi:hypothetical protein